VTRIAVDPARQIGSLDRNVGLEEGSATPKSATLTLTLPPQSFTVIEVTTASR
jgi:hypothetical protein